MFDEIVMAICYFYLCCPVLPDLLLPYLCSQLFVTFATLAEYVGNLFATLAPQLRLLCFPEWTLCDLLLPYLWSWCNGSKLRQLLMIFCYPNSTLAFSLWPFATIRQLSITFNYPIETVCVLLLPFICSVWPFRIPRLRQLSVIFHHPNWTWCVLLLPCVNTL